MIRLLRRASVSFLGLFAALTVAGCDPEPPDGTGGALLPEVEGDGGRTCGRGVAVLMTDYESTNIALLDLEGETQTGSFLSSASADTKLNAPLGGDVVFSSSRMTDELILIDRFPNGVLTLVDVESSEVQNQAVVRTGFNSNPQDVLVLDDNRLLVSRYGKNKNPGDEPFDGGDDLLIVDAESGNIIERVDLAELTEGEFQSRPGQLALVQGVVLVTLAGFDATFDEAVDARVLALNSESFEVLEAFELEGMKNCGSLAVSPDESQIALSCSGLVDSGSLSQSPHSGVVTVDLSVEDGSPVFSEQQRFTSEEIGWGPLSPGLSYASASLLIGSTYGALDGEDAGRPDRFVSFDLESGEWSFLYESQEAFTLGDVLCAEACGVCFFADAESAVVLRGQVSDGELGELTPLQVETEIGLPPRSLGWF